MKKIAICNQKGGTGKTTTAINLSATLAEKELKILLIDMDPQSHASIGLGLDVYKLEKSMYDVLTNQDIKLVDVIKETCVKNLDIAPATLSLAGAELDLSNIVGRELVLKDSVEYMRRNYDYVITDCPPSLSILTVNALTMADKVLIPIQTQYLPLEGMKQLLKTIDIVQKRLNHNLEVLGIVPTLFDKRTTLSRDVLNGIQNHFGKKVFETVIHDTIKLAEAPSAGKPVTTYAPDSRGTYNYLCLANEVLERINP